MEICIESAKVVTMTFPRWYCVMVSFHELEAIAVEVFNFDPLWLHVFRMELVQYRPMPSLYLTLFHTIVDIMNTCNAFQ